MLPIDPEEDAWLKWEESMARLGLKYVPAVVISRARGAALILEIFAPVSAPAGSSAIVFVRPYLFTLRGGGPLEEGTLKFHLNGAGNSELGRVDLSDPEVWTEDWVEFEFHTPEESGTYRLVVRYEGPYGEIGEEFRLRVVDPRSDAYQTSADPNVDWGTGRARPRPRHRQYSRRRRRPRGR
ncbi:hypothetical protein [Methanopyrus sp.]